MRHDSKGMGNYPLVCRLDRISDLVIQAITGHSSNEVINCYSHVEKVIDFKAMMEKLARAVRDQEKFIYIYIPS